MDIGKSTRNYCHPCIEYDEKGRSTGEACQWAVTTSIAADSGNLENNFYNFFFGFKRGKKCD